MPELELNDMEDLYVLNLQGLQEQQVEKHLHLYTKVECLDVIDLEEDPNFLNLHEKLSLNNSDIISDQTGPQSGNEEIENSVADAILVPANSDIKPEATPLTCIMSDKPKKQVSFCEQEQKTKKRIERISTCSFEFRDSSSSSSDSSSDDVEIPIMVTKVVTDNPISGGNFQPKNNKIQPDQQVEHPNPPKNLPMENKLRQVEVINPNNNNSHNILEDLTESDSILKIDPRVIQPKLKQEGSQPLLPRLESDLEYMKWLNFAPPPTGYKFIETRILKFIDQYNIYLKYCGFKDFLNPLFFRRGFS